VLNNADRGREKNKQTGSTPLKFLLFSMDIKKGIKEKKDAYCNECQGTEKKYKRDDRKDKKKTYLPYKLQRVDCLTMAHYSVMEVRAC